MLLGLGVLPGIPWTGTCQRLMRRYLAREQARGRKRAILTCVDGKIGMYERMGFEYIGTSASVLGNAKWNEMGYIFS